MAIDVAILSNEFLATINTSKNHSFDVSGVGVYGVELFFAKEFLAKTAIAC